MNFHLSHQNKANRRHPTHYRLASFFRHVTHLLRQPLTFKIIPVATLLILTVPATPFIYLDTLTPGQGFAITGNSLIEEVGNDVAAVGDVNGDGFDDFVVAQQFTYNAQATVQDAAYLVFGNGSHFPSTVDGSSLDGTNGVRLYGVQNKQSDFGLSVAGAGDINGDGYNDIIIGAPRAPKAQLSPDGTISGQAYIIYGREVWPSSFSADFLFGSIGTVINGEGHNDHAGIRVAGAGDVNGDGYDDFIVHRQQILGPIYLNKTYVVFGKNQLVPTGTLWFELGSINGQNGFVIDGSVYTLASEYPLEVAGAGDVNGDGYDDIIIAGKRGAPFLDTYGYVIFGRGSNFAPVVNPSQLAGHNGFRFNVPYSSEAQSLPVASAGDVNGDGYADIIVGPGEVQSLYPNQFYVIFGKETWGAGSITLPGYLTGANGFTMETKPGNNHSWQLGSLAGAGDVNGDGHSDILVGSHKLPGAGGLAGESQLIFGKSTLPAKVTVPSRLDPEVGRVYYGDATSFSGYSLSGAGDINNDGFTDFLIGAPNYWPNGKAYLVYGFGDANSSATYQSRTRAGNSPATAVGIAGDPGYGTSPSRAWLDFDAGTARSLESATITRSKTGLSGFARPNEVADVTWEISTTRQGWNNVQVTLKYTDKEIEALPTPESQLLVYAAPTPDGPWTQKTTTVDEARNQVKFSVAFGQLSHYAIATPTATDASVDDWPLY